MDRGDIPMPWINLKNRYQNYDNQNNSQRIKCGESQNG